MFTREEIENKTPEQRIYDEKKRKVSSYGDADETLFDTSTSWWRLRPVDIILNTNVDPYDEDLFIGKRTRELTGAGGRYVGAIEETFLVFTQGRHAGKKINLTWCASHCSEWTDFYKRRRGESVDRTLEIFLFDILKGRGTKERRRKIRKQRQNRLHEVFPNFMQSIMSEHDGLIAGPVQNDVPIWDGYDPCRVYDAPYLQNFWQFGRLMWVEINMAGGHVRECSHGLHPGD